MKKKEELYSCSQQDHNAMAETDIKMVPIADLHDFEGHPFKVENDMALFELMQSIEKEGVIVPALARPRAEGGYELIAGHRRKAASKWAGLDVMPVVIRELDDNQAVIAMVDSNLQRESILPSEKAFAYKMKLEAVERTLGRPNKNNVGQVVPNSFGKRTTEIIGEQTGESYKQIQRYIRLTHLIPDILEMVDNKNIAFNAAVEISYLSEKEQKLLHDNMDVNECSPSLSQAKRLKKYSQEGKLTL